LKTSIFLPFRQGEAQLQTPFELDMSQVADALTILFRDHQAEELSVKD
jgi:hypothetical protein